MSEFVKDRTYKELCPVSIYDVAAVETWLEDRAREGWRITGIKGVKGHFAWEGARTCRYRLKPLLKKEKAPDPEWVEFYRDLGWEYVTTIRRNFHVWRSDDPDAPELDTDPVVQGEGYRWLKRRITRQAIIYLLLLLALMGLMVWSWPASGMPLWTALERDFPLEMPFLVLIIVLGIVLGYLDLRNMNRLLHTLRTGLPLERPKPYRLQKRVAQAVCAVLAAFWIVQILSSFGGSPTSQAYAWPAGDSVNGPKSGVVYVDLRALDDVPEDCVGYHSIETKIHPLAPRMYWTWQGADPPDGTGLVAYTSYYHLLTDQLTPVLERDLLTWQTHFDDEVPMEQIDDGALDGFWWRTVPSGRQFVIAALGRNVLYIQYQGPTDLRAAGDYFAALLKEA